MSYRAHPHAPRRSPGVHRRVVAAVALTAGVLTGCSEAGDVRTEALPAAETAAPSAAPSAGAFEATTPSASPDSGADEIRSQYEAFWVALAEAGAAEADEREALLEPVAVEPELSRALGGIQAADRLGEELYGAVEPRIEDVEIDGDRATIRDCQDASEAGRRDEDGEIVTKGGERDLAEVTMRRDDNGTWRVATIEYRTGEKC